MTLPGVTPFPPEFAARYRARGYWADRPLIAHFLDAFDQFAGRMAVIDDTGSVTYAELAQASQRVALNLLDLGLRPGDRVVLQLPNTRLFASLYFGLQRIGAIPIMALPSHRHRELRQFVGLSGDALEAADWDRVFAVNVRGMFQVTRACVPLLRAAPHPAIVNSASIVGLRPGPQPYPYSASKAAVISLTRTLAGALGPQILVNAVAPGWMEGEWMRARLGENYDRLMQRRARMTPLGRCVTAADVGGPRAHG